MAATDKARSFYQYLITQVVPNQGWPGTLHELQTCYEEFRKQAHGAKSLPIFHRIYHILVNNLRVLGCSSERELYWADDWSTNEQLTTQSGIGEAGGNGPQSSNRVSVFDGIRLERRLGPREYKCSICDASCGNPKNYQQHMNGKKHRLKAQRESERAKVDTPGDKVPATSPGHPAVSMPPPQTRFHAECPHCGDHCWTAGALKAHVNACLSLPDQKPHLGHGVTAGEGTVSAVNDAATAGNIGRNVGERTGHIYYCPTCETQLSADDAATHKCGEKETQVVQGRLTNGSVQPAVQQAPETNAPLQTAREARPSVHVSQRIQQVPERAGLPNQGFGLAPNPQPLHASTPVVSARAAPPPSNIVPGTRAHQRCTVCGLELDRKPMKQHVAGRRHRAMIGRRDEWLAKWGGDAKLRCFVCNRGYRDAMALRNHQDSDSHLSASQGMMQLSNLDATPGGKRLREESPASGGAPPGVKRLRGELPASDGAPAGVERVRARLGEVQLPGAANAAAPPVPKRKREAADNVAAETDVGMSSEERLRQKQRSERFGDGKVTGTARNLPAPAVANPGVQVSSTADGPEDTGKRTKKFTPIMWTPKEDSERSSAAGPERAKQVSDRMKRLEGTLDGRRVGGHKRTGDGVEKRVSGSGRPTLGDAPILNGVPGAGQRERDPDGRTRERVDGTTSRTTARSLRNRLGTNPAKETGLSASGHGHRVVKAEGKEILRVAVKNDVRPVRADVQSRTDVTVSRPFLSENKFRSAAPETELAEIITVRNRGEVAVSLLGYKITPPSGVFSLTGISAPGGVTTRAEFPVTVIGGGGCLSLALRCKTPPEVGVVSARLELEFDGFRVKRDLRVSVEDEEIRAMRSNERYRPPRVTPKQSALRIVTDPSPPLACQARFPRELRRPCVGPEVVGKAVAGGEDLAEVDAPLDVDNYAAKFTMLGHLEALQKEVDIHHYDILSAKLTSSRVGWLELHVPGLAAGRPSVVKGDRVYLTPARGSAHQQSRRETPFEFEAFVHEVIPNIERILLKSTHLNDRTTYSVRFRPNPETLSHAQHALRLIADDPSFPPLAPLVDPIELPSVLEETEPPDFDRKDLQLNDEQAEAVSQILLRTQLRSELERDEPLPPYVVFGPPGTGKTKTLVEMVFQVHLAEPDASILVCAPSNGAADNVTERLKEMKPGDLIRVNAFHRLKGGPGAMSAHLEKFAQYDDRETHSYTVPPLHKLRHARVIVTTCSSSALLWRAGMYRGEFSHIFIDEAGHATEPETFIPLGCFATPDTVIVLAGDHQQLGPTVRSPLAKAGGLGVSYLERLYGLAFYNPEAEGRFVGFNASVITKLLRNYRSHPSILQLPWGMFYQDDLLAVADRTQRESLCALPQLPRRGFPIIFEGVADGLEEREGSSPSWFNLIELRKMLRHVEKLRDSRSPRIEMKTVGVITQFAKQNEKAKNVLEAKGFGAVKVGTVEEFQGQEMRVIIVLLVRTSLEHVEFDKQHGLGFLGQPKRFNVAVTRAKELLIIIGNPHVLAQDEYWGEMLRFCVEKGGYTGPRLPSLEDDEDAEDAPEASLGEYVPLGWEEGTENGTENGDANEDGEEALLSRTRPSHVALYEEPAWQGPE